LSRVAQPTLILHGDADAFVPLQSSQWLAQTLPHAELVVLPGVGHVPTLTRPHAVAQGILRFFGR
jgi:pimeloyl-ACP methyl ester carboxylesterase